ncbi:unnamed protein product [Cuscuta campestris]|uniref:TFIIS N-terminal domain-containing protein n=1 Tax=Cuscuta campestris TaxID=132261 RepID=A0A484MT94_9ASTE|nr:unnamed protein product [Cuscuta campestris]
MATVNEPPTCQCGGCTCDAKRKAIEAGQKRKLVMFLMGLNDVFDVVRGQILLIEPFPYASKACSLVPQVERQKTITGAYTIGTEMAAYANGNDVDGQSIALYAGKANNQSQPFFSKPDPRKNKGICTYSKGIGHVKEQCFKLVGYPDWFKGNKGKKGQSSYGGNKFAGNAMLQNQSDCMETPLEVLDAENEGHSFHANSALVKNLAQEVMRMMNERATQSHQTLIPSTPMHTLQSFSFVSARLYRIRPGTDRFCRVLDMGEKSGSLDEWRVYFKSANADIFGIIEQAIKMAAIDKPNELALKRARIAEMLFTCKPTLCTSCNNAGLALPTGVDDVQAEPEKTEADKSKESKKKDEPLEMDSDVINQMSHSSYVDVEALNDEIEEESQTVLEVSRIKKIIDNHDEESESLVIGSLRKLQLMDLSVEILKATDIGKSVNALRKRKSAKINHLVRALIGAWKAKVDEWVIVTETVAGRERALEKEEEEEEGLPSPPMDEGAFFTTSTMDLSQFFDDIDENGNLRNSKEANNKFENDLKKAAMQKPSSVAPKERFTNKPKAEEKKPMISSSQDWFTRQPKEHETPIKKPIASRPNKACAKRPQPVEHKAAIDKKCHVSQPSKVKCKDEDSIRAKLEVAKKKLKERYDSLESAKKQRTTQFLEMHEIPKQCIGNKNAHVKPGHYSKH